MNIQIAGKNSTQIIQSGVSEKRATEIFDERLEHVLQSYSIEAHSVAIERNKLFMYNLIKKLSINNFFEHLKDPSIQITLSDAQKIAACTERTDDYEMLSDLILQRIANSNNRNVKANISYAISVVDKITDEALFGLTLIYAMQRIFPKSGHILKGLDELDNNIFNIIKDR